MILYADTSALVKKYVRETDSDQVVEFFNQYEIIGTAMLTKAELAAALSKAARQGWIDQAETSSAWQDFLSHWLTYVRLPVSASIVDRASSLAWKYRLRGYDSIHLSSALTWHEVIGNKVLFACFNNHLQEAARQENLLVWP
jgi:predicted nucleic acid-binding protein